MLMLKVIKRAARELSDAVIEEVETVDSKNASIEAAFFAVSVSAMAIVTVFFVVPYVHSLKDQVSLSSPPR